MRRRSSSRLKSREPQRCAFSPRCRKCMRGDGLGQPESPEALRPEPEEGAEAPAPSSGSGRALGRCRGSGVPRGMARSPQGVRRSGRGANANPAGLGGTSLGVKWARGWGSGSGEGPVLGVPRGLRRPRGRSGRPRRVRRRWRGRPCPWDPARRLGLLSEPRARRQEEGRGPCARVSMADPSD